MDDTVPPSAVLAGGLSRPARWVVNGRERDRSPTPGTAGARVAARARSAPPTPEDALVGQSRIAHIGGPVHYTDLGGPADPDAPAMLYVHGLGGSHLNWALLATHLAPHVRAYAIDLIGFGLTEPLGRPATVAANARLVRRFITTVIGRPTILVGNSMGGMISMLAATSEPYLVDRLVLISPVLPLRRGVRIDPLIRAQFLASLLPGVGSWALQHRLLSLPIEERVRQVIELCVHDPQGLPQDMVAAAVRLEQRRAAHRGSVPAYLDATRSLARSMLRPAAYRRMMATLRTPVLLVHGAHDRLVPVGLARATAASLPGWSYTELDAGHVAQLEAPQTVAERITGWLSATASQPVVT